MQLDPPSQPPAASSDDVAENKPAVAGAPPGKKPRSHVERAIVWGLILVLAGVALTEFRAHRGLAADRDAVNAVIEEKPPNEYVTEAEVQALVTRYDRRESNPSLKANSMAAKRVDTYTYFSLLKKRVLYVYFGLKQEVISVTEEPVEMYTSRPFEFDAAPPAGEPEKGQPPTADEPGAQRPEPVKADAQ